ncbi:hypothetical protein FRC01_004255, partial [Tulasnella sp. 417]
MAARATRLWCDIALDWLWRELDSVLPLLRLLAPLAETSTGLAFAGKIEPRKWERFRYYSHRVRSLHHNDSDWDPVTHLISCSLSSDTSLILLATRPAGFGALLQNVREIDWAVSHDIVNLQHALPFVHGSLKRLTITVDEIDIPDDNDAIARFLNTIWAMQVFSLETFGFDIMGVPTEILQSLTCFLQSQPTIKVLEIPITGFAPGSDAAQDLFHQSFTEGLQRLSTAVSFRGPTDYLTRTQTIAKRAPQLQELELSLIGTTWMPSTFDDLTPFLTLSNLEELELIALHGFHLDPGDIVMLGKSFPKMARFDLQPQTRFRTRFGIRATSLIYFANAFPNLRELSVYIESVTDPIQLPWRSEERDSQGQVQALPSFNPSTFQLLTVGTSFLADKDIPDMAELLSVLCHNPSFEIGCVGKETNIKGPTLAWRKVEALVRLVQRADRDEANPYDEWCRALILEKVASGEWPDKSDSSTGSHAYPEMHRMLAVHEIVSNVLRNARSHDQAMAARASRLWCDIALDWLWRELDSVLPLLRLLAPLAETSSGLAFAERIDPHNWERFRHYARRVRFLRYDGSDPDPAAQLSSSGLASDVSVTLLTLKPSGFGPLLPHIQEINWFISHDIVNLQHALPFFSRSLKTLGITLGDVDAMEESDAVARFFNTASSIRGLALDIFDLEMTGMP